MKIPLLYLPLASLMLVLAASVQAGWLDSLKKGIDDVSKGVDSAKEMLDGKNGKANQPKPAPQRQNTQPASAGAQAGVPKSYESNWPLLEIKSPDPATIRSLQLESFRGEIVLAKIANVDGGFRKMTDSGSRQYFQNNQKMYKYLLVMNEKSARLNRERLKAGFLGGTASAVMKHSSAQYQFNSELINEYRWFLMLTNLAANTMTDAGYQKYFCPKSGDCVLPSLAKQRNQTVGTSWGGLNVQNADEFHAKRVFNEFVDKELDKYFSMAKQTRKVAYVVVQNRIGKYDFNEGGYRFNAMPSGQAFLMNRFLGVPNGAGWERSEKEAVRQFRLSYNKYYYRLSEDKAPAFAEKIKKTNNWLAIVYKVSGFTPYNNPASQSTDLDVSNVQYVFDPSHLGTVDVYYDLSFSEKAFSVP